MSASLPTPARSTMLPGTWVLPMALLLASLPALLFPEMLGDAAQGAVALAAGHAPEARDRLLAYGIAPLLALSATLLFLAPGLLLTRLAGDDGSHADRWLVRSAAVSLVVVSAIAAVGQGIAGDAFRGRTFGAAIAVVTVLVAVATMRRPSRATASSAAERAALVLAIAFPLALAVLFAPKLHWESFNGDGAHSFETSRLLLTQPLPFWPESSGDVRGFPGITSMLFAFPAAWYVRLFGAVDAAARLPFLLYLSLLVAALAWLVRTASDRRAFALESRVLLWLAVTAYAISIAWSATYNPYAADIALPATQDTLLMVVYLGFLASFLERRMGWAIGFAILTYVSLPNGLILLAFWAAALFVAWRPMPWREIRWMAGLGVALVVGGALAPRVLALLHLPLPGSEYGLVGLLRYFAFLRFTDVGRLVWIALPCAVAPIAALLLWGRQDKVARALTLVTVAYFLFFYVQANVSLHHFIPAMVLPLVVLWRVIPEGGEARGPWIAATGVAAIVSLVLVWPTHAEPHLDARRVGSTVWNRIGGYEHSDPDSFRGLEILAHFFPVDWEPIVPSVYGGSPVAWHRYARLSDDAQVNYIVQRSGTAAPDRARLALDSAGFALWVRSDSVLAVHQALHAPTPPGSPWLSVPRSTLFRTVKPAGNTHVIDVAATLAQAGLPIDAILAKLGVHR